MTEDAYSSDPFLHAAIEEAKKGRAAGGIPIGSVLVIDGGIVGRGHNQRVHKGSPVLHAEMDCIENAGRLAAADYRRATIYSTLSPCDSACPSRRSARSCFTRSRPSSLARTNPSRGRRTTSARAAWTCRS